jgi:hypothetical protein
MPFVARDPLRLLISCYPMESAECVALIKFAAKAPQTSLWRRGQKVRGANILAGTAIATFDASPIGNYGVDTARYPQGRPHAAIYLRQDPSSIHVIDQWVGQAAHQRPIRFKHGAGAPADDGDQFFVVEGYVC